MSFGVVQAEKVTTESGYSLGAGNASSFKNRLINPGMVIDQRNNGAAVTNLDGYLVDRWMASSFGAAPVGRVTGQRSTLAPAGFQNSFQLTVTTPSTSLAATEAYLYRQQIEGFNVADLGWGTADAKTVTISLWVRSSVPGNYTVALNNGSPTRAYVTPFTINSANTWEYKTVTIPGDTTGTWATDNTTAIQFIIGLSGGTSRTQSANSWQNTAIPMTCATGQTNWIGTNGATFNITGCQLEVGTVATSFDFRSYGTELQLCQRYYESLYTANSTMSSVSGFIALGVCESTSRVQPYYPFKVQKRASPSTTLSAISTFGMRSANGSSVVCTSGAFGAPSNTYAQGEFNCGSSPMTSGGCGWLTNHDGNAKIEWSSEL